MLLLHHHLTIQSPHCFYVCHLCLLKLLFTLCFEGWKTWSAMYNAVMRPNVLPGGVTLRKLECFCGMSTASSSSSVKSNQLFLAAIFQIMEHTVTVQNRHNDAHVDTKMNLVVIYRWCWQFVWLTRRCEEGNYIDDGRASLIKIARSRTNTYIQFSWIILPVETYGWRLTFRHTNMQHERAMMWGGLISATLWYKLNPSYIPIYNMRGQRRQWRGVSLFPRLSNTN